MGVFIEHLKPKMPSSNRNVTLADVIPVILKCQPWGRNMVNIPFVVLIPLGLLTDDRINYKSESLTPQLSWHLHSPLESSTVGP